MMFLQVEKRQKAYVATGRRNKLSRIQLKEHECHGYRQKEQIVKDTAEGTQVSWVQAEGTQVSWVQAEGTQVS